MLSPDRVARYLARIGVERGPADAATLTRLQDAHLRTVPFENLDIHRRVEILLDEDRLVDKILSGRGGFCYELNGAFAALLEALGFRVDRLEARVGDGDTPFDHLCLLVHLEEEWLVDVGFGASFGKPLPLREGVDLFDPNGVYRVESRPDGWWALRENGQLAYRFVRRARRISEFEPGKVFHTTSPLSHFTKAPLITLPTPRGRITLRGSERIETVDGVKTSTPIAPGDWKTLLREHFGVDLDFPGR